MSKQWRRWLTAACLFASAAQAQTQLSLSSQSRSADLSNVGPTKPMQTGAVLPATCSTGQMFFLTTAAAGANLYACTATNVWSAIVGAGGGSASLSGGTGIVISTSSGTSTVAIDPAAIPTKSQLQASQANAVTLTSTSTSALTGTQNPTLAAYADKQLIEFSWNVNCAGGAMTISIDSLAATSLVKSDGATNLAAADCLSGQTNLFTYDGSIGKFKLMAGGALSAGVTFAPPYMISGGNNYLPFGFQATLPPASGWTPLNFSGAFFNTSGANGAVSLDLASLSTDQIQGQFRSIGSTTTLIAAVSGSWGQSVSGGTGGGWSGDHGRCGIGVYNSSTGEVESLVELHQAAGPFSQYISQDWSNSTTFNFSAGAGSPAVSYPIGFLKITYTGGLYTSFYSSNGYKWQILDLNRSFSGGNNWIFLGTGGTGTAGAGAGNCTLYSWSAQ